MMIQRNNSTDIVTAIKTHMPMAYAGAANIA
jgi:hypothetical protein